MRLVDADDAVNRFEELKPKGSSLDARYAYGVSVGLEMAKHVTTSELSTVDAVEVVRCRECRWCNMGECEHKFGLLVCNDENYCSYGERDVDI